MSHDVLWLYFSATEMWLTFRNARIARRQEVINCNNYTSSTFDTLTARLYSHVVTRVSYGYFEFCLYA